MRNKIFCLVTILAAFLFSPAVFANLYTFYNNNLVELNSHDVIQFKLIWKVQPPYGGYYETVNIGAEYSHNYYQKYLGGTMSMDYDIYIRNVTKNGSYIKCGSGHENTSYPTKIYGSLSGNVGRCVSYNN